MTEPTVPGCLRRVVGVIAALVLVSLLAATIAFSNSYNMESAREGRPFVREIQQECGVWKTLKWMVRANPESDPPGCAKREEE